MEAHQEFAKEQYSFELDRKDKLNSEASFVLTALGISASIVSFVFSKIDFPFSLLEWLSLGLLSLSFGASGKVVLHLWAFLKGYEYEYVSAAPKILEYHKKLKDHENSSPEAQKASELLPDALALQYAQAAQTNRVCNVAKSGLLLRMKRTLFIAIIPAVLAGSFVSASSWSKQSSPPAIKIEVKI